ncbi:MAG: DUF1015 domain-containing protein [Collinsella sp.]|nr:DUF1015 domain-containing protein [Collinsella sp.]
MKALPFPCIRPVPEHAAEVASLPYDVFDRDEAAAYVASRPLSFLNIDRPETQFEPGHDMYAPDVYERAAQLLRERIDDRTLLRDPGLSYYIYELEMEGRTQTGLVAVCSIDEYERGVIKRHELTREEKERDRIEHMRALGCQTGPILLAYRDQPVLDMILGAAKAATPLYSFVDEEDVRQTVWEIKRRDSVEAIHAMMEAIPCAYIADGHHRTASAMRVAHVMRQEAEAAGAYTGKEPFNFFLSVLFPASQLTILPYNRVVSDRCGMSGEDLANGLRAAGFVVDVADEAVEPRERGFFGMYAEGRWWSCRPGAELASRLEGTDPVSALDVSMLQEHVLGPILGIGDPRLDPRISFVGGIRGTGELELRAGNEGVAFSLCATSMDQLLDVADAGMLMPPKSTWFEPKLRSGLFMHQISK